MDEIMKPTLYKLMKVDDREKRIDGLKKMITNINARNKR